MHYHDNIPVFSLFGETSPFPDVIHCERIHDRAFKHDWSISPHRHANMSQIFYMENGSATVRIDATEENLHSGDFLFVPVQTVHGFVFSKGAEGLVLSFPQPVVESLAPRDSSLQGTLSQPFQGRCNDQFLNFVGMLQSTYQSDARYRAQSLVALSHAIFATACETQAGHSKPPVTNYETHAKALGSLILEKAVLGWRTGDYARALGLTPGHLNRICQQTFGQSATAHIEATVMNEATRMLAFTRLTIAEIGYRLGYDDPTYFSRRFRKFRDQSPSEYRRAFFSSES